MACEVVEDLLSDIEVRLDADERRSKSFDVEPGQGLGFGEFDIHGQEINSRHTFAGDVPVAVEI